MTISIVSNVSLFKPARSTASSDIKIYQDDNVDYTLAYSAMNNARIESNFTPYVRAFVQRWHAYLKREDKMFAEVFAHPIDGMIGVAFYVVDRQEFQTLMQIVDGSLEKIKAQFPNVAWSQFCNCHPFIDVTENVIVVIKPNCRYQWGEDIGYNDSDDTIRRQFISTLPKE